MRPSARSRGSVERDVAGVDRQLSALRHGIACVQRQVHEHLFHPARVGLHPRQIGRQTDAGSDVLADGSREHLQQAGDRFVQIDHGRRQELLAAEGQELSRQRGAAVGGLADLGDVAADRTRLLDVLGDHVRVADDGGQQVVEVVGDAAGEPADRLHLLRVTQLLIAVVQQAHRLPRAQGIADGPFQLRGHHVLLDVIRRAGARGLLVERQAAVAGHQDERFVDALRPCVGNQIHAGAVRQLLIDEVEIVIVLADALESDPDVGDHVEGHLKPRVGQRHLDQRSRLRVVVDDQNADDVELWQGACAERRRGVAAAVPLPIVFDLTTTGEPCSSAKRRFFA